VVAIVNLKIAMEHEVIDGNKWSAKIQDRSINDTTVVILACQRLGGMTLTEIARHFNLALNGAGVNLSFADQKRVG
jgi:alkyl hydroperoxide reductase subunit AhpF